MKYSWKANLFPARLARFLAKKTVEHIVWRSGKKTLVTNTSHTTLLRDMWRQTWDILMFQIEWSIYIYTWIYAKLRCWCPLRSQTRSLPRAVSIPIFMFPFPTVMEDHGSITELNMAWRTHTHTELDSYYSYRMQSNAKKYESTSKIPHMKISNLSKQNVITIKNSSTLTKQHNIQCGYHQHDAAWHSVPVSQHRHQTWHHSPSSQLVCLHEIRH